MAPGGVAKMGDVKFNSVLGAGHTDYTQDANCMGAEVAVQVSLATMAMASINQFSEGGNEKVPNRQPPAPHHLLKPLLMIVPSG